LRELVVFIGREQVGVFIETSEDDIAYRIASLGREVNRVVSLSLSATDALSAGPAWGRFPTNEPQSAIGPNVPHLHAIHHDSGYRASTIRS
jgi:hypothetical protein